MEKEIIISTVATLPSSELARIADDHEIWEETEGTVHFKVTRHKLPIPNGPSLIALTVSGEIEGDRRVLVDQFVEVFGEPAQSTVDQDDGLVIETHAWLEI